MINVSKYAKAEEAKCVGSIPEAKCLLTCQVVLKPFFRFIGARDFLETVQVSPSQHHIIAEIGMTPPLYLFSLHLPNAAHGPEPFAQAIDDFYRDRQDLGAAIFLIGGSDANTTLRTTKGTVGPYLGCRKWGFKRWGFKEIRGYLRKKAFFLRFLDFPGALGTLRKRAKKAEKGRFWPFSADFQEGRPDTP